MSDASADEDNVDAAEAQPSAASDKVSEASDGEQDESEASDVLSAEAQTETSVAAPALPEIKPGDDKAKPKANVNGSEAEAVEAEPAVVVNAAAAPPVAKGADSATVTPSDAAGAGKAAAITAHAGKLEATSSEENAAGTATKQQAGQPQSAAPNAAGVTSAETPPSDTSGESKEGKAKPLAATHAAPTAATPGDRPVPDALTTLKLEAPAPPPARPEQTFRQQNVDNVVQQVHTKLMPGGGTMQIRLDPPSLGNVTVSVEVVDGALTASFIAKNPEAARLLSQSLGQLKTSLETSGVSVDRLTVRHAPDAAGNGNASSDRNDSQRETADPRQQRSDEHRREQLRRMWAKAAGQDDVDVMA